MTGGEDEITEWFEAQSSLSPADFPIGIGDDMAEVRIGGESVLITTDMLLEGVHFDLGRASLEQVGYKAMAVSLSDCAAMATIPIAAVVSVALPGSFGRGELERLHSGIVTAGERFGCALIGGDITSWRSDGAFAVNVSMLSRPAGNPPVTRAGAEVGDRICVTGSLGGSLDGRHLEFEPRVEEALAIAGLVEVHAMIDISDGLSRDLNRICRRSGVGAVVEAAAVPISDAARAKPDPLDSALNDGEDFELLLTVSEADCRRLLKGWRGPTQLTEIGVVVEPGTFDIRLADGTIRELKVAGYDHLERA